MTDTTSPAPPGSPAPRLSGTGAFVPGTLLAGRYRIVARVGCGGPAPSGRRMSYRSARRSRVARGGLRDVRTQNVGARHEGQSIGPTF
jgi:hypothetical protein